MNDFHKHQYKWRITTTKNAIPADVNVLKVIATGTSTLYFFHMHVFLAYVTIFDLPARGQPHSVFGVCAYLARVCLLLALANSLPQQESGSL